MAHRNSLDALNVVLASVDAVRNLRALYVLLVTFSIAALFTAMAEASLAKNIVQIGAVEAGAALFAAFYSGNAAGILVMDDARGGPVSDISSALRTSLLSAHRLLLALALLSGAYAVFAGLLYGLLWLCRVSVTGPVAGPLLFGVVVPVGGVGVAVALLSLVVVVVLPRHLRFGPVQA